MQAASQIGTQPAWRQAVEECIKAEDFDSPDRPILTALGLQRYLAVGDDWVEKNTLAKRIPGAFKVGKGWRYEKAAIDLQRLTTGQVLRTPKARRAA